VDEDLLDDELAAHYSEVLEIRRAALAALEQAKDAGEVQNPVEARLDLYVTDEQRRVLESLEQDLETLLIVSKVEVHHISDHDDGPASPSGMRVVASMASGDKCDRCWKRTETIGTVKEHPKLCRTCAERVNRILAG